MKFEIYKDNTGKWRWRLRARNHEIIAQGQGYRKRADCLHVIKLIRRTTKGEVIDLVEEKKRLEREKAVARRKTAKRKTAKRKTARRKTAKRKTAKRRTAKRKTARRKTAKRKTARRKTAKRKVAKRKTARRKSGKRQNAGHAADKALLSRRLFIIG